LIDKCFAFIDRVRPLCVFSSHSSAGVKYSISAVGDVVYNDGQWHQRHHRRYHPHHHHHQHQHTMTWAFHHWSASVTAAAHLQSPRSRQPISCSL